MPDTTNRPTPEELRLEFLNNDNRRAIEVYLDALAEHGYVIVHPDDVPAKLKYPDAPLGESSVEDPAHDRAWNACRAHIFGDDQ